MMKTLAIIGGKGMLGSDLQYAAEKAGYSVVIFDRPEFDVTDAEDVRRAVVMCDVIVNCAAYTAVDQAESEPEMAYAINAAAVKKLGETCAQAGKYLVHISTDFVFGDASENYLRETDNPSPLSVYGKTKLEGEILLAQTACRHAVIRVQWTYGQGGNNFIYKIIELAKSRSELKVVEDQVGAPTPTTAVAQAILCFLAKQPEGLFHFAADGYASRYETAVYIARKLELPVKINPCDSSEFPVPATRPLNSRFDCSKIDGILDFPRPHWYDALKVFLKKIN
jgi:dTDP-4-dehydrorhamnose reductase